MNFALVASVQFPNGRYQLTMRADNGDEIVLQTAITADLGTEFTLSEVVAPPPPPPPVV